MLGKGPYQERSNSLPRTLVKDNYPGQYRLTKSNYKYQRQQNQPRTKYIPARKITHRQIRPWINLSLCFNVLRSISLSSSHCPFKEDTSPPGMIVWILRRFFLSYQFGDEYGTLAANEADVTSTPKPPACKHLALRFTAPPLWRHLTAFFNSFYHFHTLFIPLLFFFSQSPFNCPFS